MKKLLLIIAFLSVGSAFVMAQEKVLFRYKPTVGEKINYEMNMNMDIEGEQSMVMDMKMKMSQTVSGKDEANIYSVSSLFESIKVDMNMGMMMGSYDSENPNADDPIAQQLGQQFDKILNNDFTVKIDEKATVVEISEADALAGMGDLKSMFSSTTFPEQALAVGESWETTVENPQLNESIGFKFTYAGQEEGLVRVNIESAPKAEDSDTKITATGYSLYDPKTFSVIKSDLTTTINAQGTTVINKVLMEKI